MSTFSDINNETLRRFLELDARIMRDIRESKTDDEAFEIVWLAQTNSPDLKGKMRWVFGLGVNRGRFIGGVQE